MDQGKQKACALVFQEVRRYMPSCHVQPQPVVQYFVVLPVTSVAIDRGADSKQNELLGWKASARNPKHL
jgi:hypothetical protein